MTFQPRTGRPHRAAPRRVTRNPSANKEYIVSADPSSTVRELDRPDSADPGIEIAADPSGLLGLLIGSRCADCKTLELGRREYCPNCGSGDLSNEVLPPRGTLTAFAVVHRPARSWVGPTPYVLGEIETAAGPTHVAEVVDVAPESLVVGMDLWLSLLEVPLPQAGPVVVPKWSPARPAGGGRSAIGGSTSIEIRTYQ